MPCMVHVVNMGSLPSLIMDASFSYAFPDYDPVLWPSTLMLILTGSPPGSSAPCSGVVLLELVNYIGTPSWGLSSSVGPSGLGTVSLVAYPGDATKKYLTWDGFTFGDLSAIVTEISDSYDIDVTMSSGQTVLKSIVFGWNPLH